MALLDDTVQFTIALHAPKGQIIQYEYPAEAMTGDGIKVFVDVKNNSASTEQYILTLVNNDTNTAITHKNLSIGANASSFGNELSTTMPAKAFNLRLDLFRVI